MKIEAAEKVLLNKNLVDKSPVEKGPGNKSPGDKGPVEKFNVAWFKLAEFVGRKEKERALSVYRLLSHSLPDDAFAAQLEGDLLMAFLDEKAVDAYQKAARLYEKNGQCDHAAFLYEQMLVLKPENKEFLVQALRLYELIDNDVKIARCATQLTRLFAE
jgi:tetratricopeptide (TPR) repeat protein